MTTEAILKPYLPESILPTKCVKCNAKGSKLRRCMDYGKLSGLHALFKCKRCDWMFVKSYKSISNKNMTNIIYYDPKFYNC